MARTQAADYEERREAILDQAAALYAAKGFLGASIADLAAACDISKSLIYHYYGSKEDILFDVMNSHVKALFEAAEDISKRKDPPPAKLRALNRRFLQLYSDAAGRHRVLLNELDQLPPRRRKAIVEIQKKIIGLVETILFACTPKAPSARLQRAATMLFFGMINWTDTWFDPKGALSAERIADLATDLILKGLESAHLAD